ncbi:MAG: hypothetical protein AAGK32_19190, partial [Actinomycetota bacterium]
MHRLPTTVASLAAATTLLSSPVALAGGTPQGEVYDLRIIALTDDFAPGAFAGEFTAFDAPTLNTWGQVAFAAYTSGVAIDAGIWSTQPGDPNALELIAGAGQYLPGDIGGERFATFVGFHVVQPEVSDDGSVIFNAPVQNDGPGVEPNGYFVHDGELESIALPGGGVIGAPGAITKWLARSYAASDGG